VQVAGGYHKLKIGRRFRFVGSLLRNWVEWSSI
jgi:hypothetical protein